MAFSIALINISASSKSVIVIFFRILCVAIMSLSLCDSYSISLLVYSKRQKLSTPKTNCDNALTFETVEK